VLAFLFVVAPESTVNAQQFENVAPGMGIVISPGSYGHAVGGGVSWFDPDQDGTLDVLGSTVTIPPILYRQKSGAFVLDEDAMLPSTPPGTAGGHLIVDIDNDGDDDVLLLREGRDALLRNDGGVFHDISDTHLPGKSVWSASAAAGDVDGDGDVDILIASYIKTISFPMHHCSENQLLINDGTGRFVDKAHEWNVGGTGCSLAVAMTDYDNDGDLDLMVVNDFGQFTQANELYRNDGPSGADGWQFTDVSTQSGWDHPMYGMGIGVSDVNDDGWLDYFVTNIGRPILVTGGPSGFTDVTKAYGADIPFGHTGFQVTWGTVLEDLDGDGWVDLFAAGGHIPATSFIGNAQVQRNVLLAGSATLPWKEMPSPWYIPTIIDNKARGVSLGDYNKDGLVDIALLDVTGMISIYKNTSNNPVPLRIRLYAQETHSGAVGTRVTATCGSNKRVRELTGGTSFASTHEPVVRITFPDACNPAGQPVDLTIRWPSGHVQTLSALTGDDVSIKESNWIVFGPNTISVSPTDTFGEPLAADTSVAIAVTGGAALKTVYVGDHTWQTDLTGIKNALLSIVINGVEMPVHPRITAPSTTMFTIHTWPQLLVRKQDFQLIAVLNPNAIKPASNAIVTAMVIQDGTPVSVDLVESSIEPGTYVAKVSNGTLAKTPVSVQIVVDQVMIDEPINVPVHPRVSAENSTIEILDRYQVGAPTIDSKPVTAHLILRDINTTYSPVGAADITMTVNGIPLEPVFKAGEVSEVALIYDPMAIPHNAALQLWLDGEPLGAERVMVYLDSESDVVPYIDVERSKCSSTIETMVADGQDTIQHMLFLRDPVGDILLTPSLQPTFTASLVSVVPGSVKIFEERLVYSVRAGTQKGTAIVTPSLYGTPLNIPCTIRLLPPNPIAEPLSDTMSEMLALPTTLPADGVSSTTLTLQPRGANNRLAGSGLQFDIQTSLGDVAKGVSYEGYGQYTATLTAPQSPGDAVVTAHCPDPFLTMSTTVLCFDPTVGPPVDTGGDDTDAQVEPMVDASDTTSGVEDAEWVEEPPVSEPMPDAQDLDAGVDTQPNDSDPSEVVDDIVVPPPIDENEPSDIRAMDTVIPDRSPPMDSITIDGPMPDVSVDTGAGTEPLPTPSSGGGGCTHDAGSSSPGGLLVTALILFVLLRTRRRICHDCGGGTSNYAAG